MSADALEACLAGTQRDPEPDYGAARALKLCESSLGADQCRFDATIPRLAALCIAEAACLGEGLDGRSAYLSFYDSPGVRRVQSRFQVAPGEGRLLWTVVATTWEHSTAQYNSKVLIDARTGQVIRRSESTTVILHHPVSEEDARMRERCEEERRGR